jgi:hypothetical protein
MTDRGVALQHRTEKCEAVSDESDAQTSLGARRPIAFSGELLQERARKMLD